MLGLARALSDCDAKFFNGWVMAGAELVIHAAAVQYATQVLTETKRRAVLEAVGIDQAGHLQQRLQVLLLLPFSGRLRDSKLSPTATGCAIPQPEGTLMAQHVFSQADIAAYLTASGDRNVLHRGSHPVVPGLCMLCWLQNFLQLACLHWRVKFSAPVYVGEAVAFYKSGAQVQGWACGRQVLTINFS